VARGVCESAAERTSANAFPVAFELTVADNFSVDLPFAIDLA
jgi:hypothetical protein